MGVTWRRSEPVGFCVRLTCLAIALSSCKSRELRGHVTSTPGVTALAIEDDNGGGCPILVDGKRWLAPLRAAVPVSSGRHQVAFACGAELQAFEVEVRPGTTYHFDYWGP